jgi:hypothetical protein
MRRRKSNSYTPTFRLEIEVFGGQVSRQEWNTRKRARRPGLGRPTKANIDKWVSDFEDSCKPGGVNSHLGFSPVLNARIVRQATGEVVASWNRKADHPEPMFQVIGPSLHPKSSFPGFPQNEPPKVQSTFAFAGAGI